MTKENRKTPEYTRRAIEKYNAKFDRVAVNLPKGTADIIREKIGDSANGYINGLVREDLTRRGLLRTGETETAADASSTTDDAPRTYRAPF